MLPLRRYGRGAFLRIARRVTSPATSPGAKGNMDNIAEFLGCLPLDTVVPPSSIPDPLSGWWVLGEFNGDVPAGKIEADLLAEKIAAAFPGATEVTHWEDGTIAVLGRPEPQVHELAKGLFDKMVAEGSLDHPERRFRMREHIDTYWRELDLVRRIGLFVEAEAKPHALLDHDCPTELYELADDHLNSSW